jgi:hypothetical protein
MRFANKYKYLPFCAKRQDYPILRVVAGNSSVTRGKYDQNPPDLSLVWSQEGALAERPRGSNRARDPVPVVVPAPVPNPSLWERFGVHAERIGTVIAFVVFVLGMLGTIIWVTWYVSKYDSRLENLEKALNGSGGLAEQVGKLVGDVAGIKSTLDAYKEILLPQLLARLKPRATKDLNTLNAEVFNVAYKEGGTNADFETPLNDVLPEVPPQNRVYISYGFKGGKNGQMTLRSKIEEVQGVRVIRTILDQTREVTLSSEVGKEVAYCFKAVNPYRQIETPFMCIHVKLLVKLGLENFVYASAVKVSDTPPEGSLDVIMLGGPY